MQRLASKTDRFYIQILAVKGGGEPSPASFSWDICGQAAAELFYSFL